jgi:adenylyltransferase/sulfurtransferase
MLLEDVGEEGQQRLKAASVLCVGAGGLGSPVLLYLAAAGVGRIGIVDFDVVDESNLQRQIAHSTATVGMPKSQSARQRILELNPRCQVDIHTVRLTSINALEIIEPYDVVVDGTDNFPTRYLVNDACVIQGKPYIYGSIHKFEGQASVFNHQGGPNYRDLFPQPPPPGLAPSCAEAGVLGILPGVIGCIQATEAIKILLQRGTSLSGRLLLYDALELSFRELELRTSPHTSPITELIDYEQFCRGGEEAAPEAFERMSVTAVHQAMGTDWTPFVLDVRRPEEARVLRLPWADTLVPHDEVAGRLSELPRDRDILVHCKRGSRSAMAAQVLMEAGFVRVVSMEGGIEAWAEAYGVPGYSSATT